MHGMLQEIVRHTIRTTTLVSRMTVIKNLLDYVKYLIHIGANQIIEEINFEGNIRVIENRLKPCRASQDVMASHQ